MQPPFSARAADLCLWPSAGIYLRSPARFLHNAKRGRERKRNSARAFSSLFEVHSRRQRRRIGLRVFLRCGAFRESQYAKVSREKSIRAELSCKKRDGFMARLYVLRVCHIFPLVHRNVLFSWCRKVVLVISQYLFRKSNDLRWINNFIVNLTV